MPVFYIEVWNNVKSGMFWAVYIPHLTFCLRFCRGCKIECTEDRASVGNAYIAVDWDPTALHLRYQTSQERVKLQHKPLVIC